MREERRLRLVRPGAEWKEQVLGYKREFEENGNSMDGTAGLGGAESFDTWCAAIEKNSCEETVTEGLVPASTFLAVRESDNYLVGMIDIRHRLNEGLEKFGGHIGYSVRKSERRKGYATEMLALALEECRKLGIDKVLVTCDKNNIASSGTMKKNGAVFLDELVNEGQITQRYEITLGRHCNASEENRT